MVERMRWEELVWRWRGDGSIGAGWLMAMLKNVCAVDFGDGWRFRRCGGRVWRRGGGKCRNVGWVVRMVNGRGVERHMRGDGDISVEPYSVGFGFLDVIIVRSRGGMEGVDWK